MKNSRVMLVLVLTASVVTVLAVSHAVRVAARISEESSLYGSDADEVQPPTRERERE